MVRQSTIVTVDTPRLSQYANTIMIIHSSALRTSYHSKNIPYRAILLNDGGKVCDKFDG